MHELRSDDGLQLNGKAAQAVTVEPLPPPPVGPTTAVGPRWAHPEATPMVGHLGEGVRDALASHNWYPTARRCGCGLSLLSAALWVDHLSQLAANQGAAAS